MNTVDLNVKVVDESFPVVWFEKFITPDNLSAAGYWDLVNVLGEYCRRIHFERKVGMELLGSSVCSAREVRIAGVVKLICEYISVKSCEKV